MQNACGQQLPLTSEAVSSGMDNYQSFPADAGEKYLILNKTPRIGKFRRYWFVAGQQVNFRVKNGKKRFKTKILSISDSSFTIASDLPGSIEHREIMLNELRLFKISKRIPFVSEAAYYFPIGGLLYIGADFINKGIDDKRFTSEASAFIVGGTLILAGLIFITISVDFRGTYIETTIVATSDQLGVPIVWETLGLLIFIISISFGNREKFLLWSTFCLISGLIGLVACKMRVLQSKVYDLHRKMIEPRETSQNLLFS